MKKHILIIIFLSVSVASSLAQTFDWKSREIKSDTDLLRTTTWLTSESSESNVHKVGTGYFFYSIKKRKLYVITNRHIVDGFNKLSFGISKKFDDDAMMTIDSLKERTLKYEDKNIDLVAVEITNIAYLNLANFKYFTVFTEKNIITDDEIKRLDLFKEDLISLSFPGITTIPYPKKPYIYHCRFATPFQDEFSSLPAFCINADLDYGCSGSPIILVKKMNNVARYILMGTDYFVFAPYDSVDKIKEAVLPDQFRTNDYIFDSSIANIGVKRMLHISIVIKAKKITELINQD